MFNEKLVVHEILQGKATAFGVLVRQYEALVFSIAGRLLSSRSDREDVAQEVFIKVYKGLPGFNFEAKLSTWIARIAYFTAIDYAKKYNKVSMSDLPGDGEQVHFTEEDPGELTARKDMARYLEQLVQQLPAAYRTVITLFHTGEFSCQEISDITGMPEGIVKSYLFRARKLLKEKLSLAFKRA
ncbi:MAG: sigma-70 family RNA polymerase sigma factor [Ilumatobacteraceae bacterium]